MLENVKIGDKVRINNGREGEVVGADDDGVDIHADWDDDGVPLGQWCRFYGRVFGYEEINWVTEVLK